MKKTTLIALILCGFLGACTDNGLLLRSNGKDYVSKDDTGIYKIGDPYQISSIWYYPREDYKYREVGIASWYGPDFHKGVTANGETYNMHALSAAHRTLPLPSIVKVTNLDNGKSVVVRVNDRGPFVNNRVIDLSKAAAEELDFIANGTAKVRVEILADESKDLKKRILDNGGKVVGGSPLLEEPAENKEPEAPIVLVPGAVAMEETAVVADNAPIYSPSARAYEPDVIPMGSGYYVQAGAFSNLENAVAVEKRLSSFGSVSIQTVERSDAPIHRVRIGPFKTGEEAAELMNDIEKSGYTDMRLVQEK